MLKHVDSLEMIGTTATKEWTIEKQVKQMKKDWEPVLFGVSPHRETGTFILKGDGIDESQTLLDDQIVKTQTMKGSPYAKPFAEEIKAWEEWLVMTQDILDSWLKVQATWLYLEPIFSSEDIVKQMPEEAANFRIVDSSWRKIMLETKKLEKVLAVTLIPNLLKQWTDCNVLLDKVTKGLNQYLETKRGFFPRFYFLSNDDLLSILSETKDPLRVQPHMKKCFEGIAKLEFQPNYDITGMESGEGEMVKMSRVINPQDAKGAGMWMGWFFACFPSSCGLLLLLLFFAFLRLLTCMFIFCL
jgi:dynein heavy chain